MVLTVRLASASTTPSGPTREPEEDRIRSMYQRALKLLQDALLPVRAHGLLLLRELVSTRAGIVPHEAVSALEPAIRDVFLQAVQDDDSYIYLNAVQGLAALTDSFGADVLRALVRVYADGLQGVGAGALTQQEVDMRLRVGEALGQVIRRCGDVLPRYGQFHSTRSEWFADKATSLCLADILIPPLFGLVRGSHIPTTIRTSSLSLLATIADTAYLSLLPYVNDLANAMLDLLQVEGARAAAQRHQPPAPPVADANSGSNTSPPYPPTVSMDSQPTAADAKFPQFRRVSLHFLGVLVRAYTRRAYASSGSSASASGVPPAYDFPVRRATTTLGYVAATDADPVVRVMAREVDEAINALQRALVGL
jgi:Required for nuclear transport of RNA pol II C-terminus 1